MKFSTRHRPGFAMVTAIMLLSLTAMTITLLGVTIVNQARRTEMVGDDAQLRQLLTAGAAFAQTHVAENSSGRFSVSLPEPLAQDSAELTVNIHGGAGAEKFAEVEVSVAHHQRSQRLTFSSQNGGWQMSAAYLGG